MESNPDYTPSSLTQANEVWKKLGTSLEARVDPMGLFMPIINASMAWAIHPKELSDHVLRLTERTLALQAHLWHGLMNVPSEGVVKAHADDTRFTDPIWSKSPYWDYIKQSYLLWSRSLQDMLYLTPGLSLKEQRRAAFWWRTFLNAVAPTNFFLTNPVAQRKIWESQGQSIVRGMENFLKDWQAGTIRMSSLDDFEVGKNLAATPGAVVYRNALLEVLHYQPTQPQVYRTPIVIISPWINKFYVLDLSAKKSLVRFLLDQGFDVFVTSWKNPGPELRNTTLDDYILQGVDKIIEVAREISGQDKVHAVGYCIGGTALSIWMAWANRRYGSPDKVPVSHWTLFTTLVDFGKPGDIEVFIDEGGVKWISEHMKETGYLDGKDMASAFRLLRSNSLIWSFAVSSYLYGEGPRPFDVLYWNMDTTRMPYAMHDYYLRELYLHNRLVQRDALVIGDEPIDLTRIVQPLYSVGAVDDHIAPWKRSFRINFHAAGPKRYVLSTSGHILGIINPPVTPPKRSFWASDVQPRDNWARWHERCVEQPGSWWNDWVQWMQPLCGERGPAPALASEKHPAIMQAPGAYVLEH